MNSRTIIIFVISTEFCRETFFKIIYTELRYGFALNFLDINLKAAGPISRAVCLFLTSEEVEFKLYIAKVTVILIPLICKT